MKTHRLILILSAAVVLALSLSGCVSVGYRDPDSGLEAKIEHDLRKSRDK